MRAKPFLRFLASLLLAAPLTIAYAAEGHDHSHDHGGGAPAGALPRITAVSESFELVGILEGRALTVYLDRFADNTPVKDAKVELEIGGVAVPLKLSGEGQFTAVLAEQPKPGTTAVTAAVTAGEETDLLSGELDLHAEPEAETRSPAWRPYARWAIGGLVALAAIAAGLLLVLRRGRGARAGTAVLLIALAGQHAGVEAADEHGHDHGPAAASANPNAPQRLPDGSVFLPKPAQRQLGLRTIVVEKASLARALELNGRILMDPNAGGRVQPMTAGRIEPVAKGLPGLGQSVKKGEVLAYVVPAIAPTERSAQAASLAELRAARGLAEKRLARLKELADTVPRKEIEAAESELAGLTERIGALSGGLSGREALVAPVGGVIAASNAVAGQVVDAREVVFDIVDPRRMRVEALAYDPAFAQEVAGAVLVAGAETIPLQFVGAAQALRENALPLVFRGEGQALSRFAVGQPVKLTVQTKARADGLAVPAAALMRDASNRTIVWVKASPERFEPRPVTTQALDGLRVAVTSGIEGGERVVTTAAGLVNQIR